MKEALDQAANYFVKQAVKIESGEKLHILKVVNANSLENDIEGKKIETEMYFALERLFPDFGLFLGPAKNRSEVLTLTGTYEPQGNETVVKLRIVKDTEVIAQTEVTYDSRARRKTLVAVLDVESKVLTAEQRRILSEVFRTALNETKTFDMASSSDVDKMNPDQIQSTYGCTRDTCATIIGEQLGVDRVISSSVMKMADDLYYLSAKIMDIEDGSILSTKTIKHAGSIYSMDRSMQTLANELTSDEDEIQPVVSTVDESVTTKDKEISEKEGSSNLVWHISAITLTVGSAAMAVSNASSYDELSAKNDELYEDYQKAVLQSELESIKNEIASNQETMKTHKNNVQMFNALTAVALLWEGYLIFFGGDDEPERTGIIRHFPIPKFALHPRPSRNNSSVSFSATWNW